MPIKPQYRELPVVQWSGLYSSTARVQSLVEELKSHMPCIMARKKKGNKRNCTP